VSPIGELHPEHLLADPIEPDHLGRHVGDRVLGERRRERGAVGLRYPFEERVAVRQELDRFRPEVQDVERGPDREGVVADHRHRLPDEVVPVAEETEVDDRLIGPRKDRLDLPSHDRDPIDDPHGEDRDAAPGDQGLLQPLERDRELGAGPLHPGHGRGREVPHPIVVLAGGLDLQVQQTMARHSLGKAGNVGHARRVERPGELRSPVEQRYRVLEERGLDRRLEPRVPPSDHDDVVVFLEAREPGHASEQPAEGFDGSPGRWPKRDAVSRPARR